jgi:hypothetical protein
MTCDSTSASNKKKKKLNDDVRPFRAQTKKIIYSTGDNP